MAKEVVQNILSPLVLMGSATQMLPALVPLQGTAVQRKDC